MFAEGSKNEQEISVVGDIGKVNPFLESYSPFVDSFFCSISSCISMIFTLFNDMFV